MSVLFRPMFHYIEPTSRSFKVTCFKRNIAGIVEGSRRDRKQLFPVQYTERLQSTTHRHASVTISSFNENYSLNSKTESWGLEEAMP